MGRGFKQNRCSLVQSINHAQNRAGHTAQEFQLGGGQGCVTHPPPLRPLSNQEYLTHHLECKCACRFQKEKGGLTLQIAWDVGVHHMWNSTLGLGLWVAYLPMSHLLPQIQVRSRFFLLSCNFGQISPNSSKAQLFVVKAFQSWATTFV